MKWNEGIAYNGCTRFKRYLAIPFRGINLFIINITLNTMDFVIITTDIFIFFLTKQSNEILVVKQQSHKMKSRMRNSNKMK